MPNLNTDLVFTRQRRAQLSNFLNALDLTPPQVDLVQPHLASLDLALRHPSTTGNEALKLKRLAFLGSAIVQQQCTAFVYVRFSAEDAGRLALRRSALASAQMLAQVARAFHFEQFLLPLGAPHSEKVLAASLQAVVATLYTSSRNDALLKGWLYTSWAQLSRSEQTTLPEHINPKGALQAWFAIHRPAATVVYRKQPCQQEGKHQVAIYVDGEVAATASGRNLRSAERRAAERTILLVRMNEPSQPSLACEATVPGEA